MEWLSAKTVQQLLAMLGMKRKRTNRGIWLSLAGLGLGAAAFGMVKGRDFSMMKGLLATKAGEMENRNPLS